MNILKFHSSLIENYRNYITSFLNIKFPGISEFVDREIRNKKLWPEPLVQFNPTYLPGCKLKKLLIPFGQADLIISLNGIGGVSIAC